MAGRIHDTRTCQEAPQRQAGFQSFHRRSTGIERAAKRGGGEERPLGSVAILLRGTLCQCLTILPRRREVDTDSKKGGEPRAYVEEGTSSSPGAQASKKNNQSKGPPKGG